MKKDQIITFVVTIILMILVPIIYKAYQCKYWSLECSESWNNAANIIFSTLSRTIEAIL